MRIEDDRDLLRHDTAERDDLCEFLEAVVDDENEEEAPLAL